MKKIIFLFVLTGIIVNTSCSTDDGENSIDSRLTGTWSGTYSGDDRGIWTVFVDSDGEVNGVATSSRNSDTFDIEGIVSDNGTLSATLGTTEDDGEFVGQLDSDDDAIGTWSNGQEEANGTWEGEKQ